MREEDKLKIGDSSGVVQIRDKTSKKKIINNLLMQTKKNEEKKLELNYLIMKSINTV